MKNKKYLLFAAIIALIAVFITIPKLYKMSQIRGIFSGAIVNNYKITNKWISEGRRNRTYYYITWAEDINNIKQGEKENIEKEKWEKLNIGDNVEIVKFQNDESSYIKDGIYDSTGNFIIDFILLSGEIFGCFFFIRKFQLR